MVKSDVMDIVRNGELVILKFKALKPLGFINHSVSTRLGGVSTLEGLESLNLGSSTADSKENIIENYKRFCAAAGYNVRNLVLTKQTHSVNVRYVSENDAGKGVFKERDYTDVDALITDKSDLPLVVHSADCVPVSFIDTRLKVIGNAHCGWRGTYGALSANVVTAMTERFGSNPADFVCTIGPAICQSCYEVSEDLYLQFLDKFSASDALVCQNGRYYIDLLLINKQILVQSGVREDNIIISDICTCCNTDYLFSHRGQGPKRGIFASCLSIV